MSSEQRGSGDEDVTPRPPPGRGVHMGRGSWGGGPGAGLVVGGAGGAVLAAEVVHHDAVGVPGERTAEQTHNEQTHTHSY